MSNTDQIPLWSDMPEHIAVSSVEDINAFKCTEQEQLNNDAHLC